MPQSYHTFSTYCAAFWKIQSLKRTVPRWSKYSLRFLTMSRRVRICSFYSTALKRSKLLSILATSMLSNFAVQSRSLQFARNYCRLKPTSSLLYALAILSSKLFTRYSPVSIHHYWCVSSTKSSSLACLRLCNLSFWYLPDLFRLTLLRSSSSW